MASSPRPAGRPRTKPAEARRDDILAAAERLFLENGVEETSIEAITRGADLSKGAFYLHFSSKADVILALRGRFVQALLDGIVAAVEECAPADWHGRLTAWSRSCAAFYLDATRLHHLVFASQPAAPHEGMTRNVLIDHLTQLLADGAGGKAWAVPDPAFTAIFLFNALHGVVNQDGVSNVDRHHLLLRIDTHFRRAVGLLT